VANARKSEQFDHELAQPRRILLEMNHAGMEVRSLCRQPQDLVALELPMVLVGVDSFAVCAENSIRIDCVTESPKHQRR